VIAVVADKLKGHNAQYADSVRQQLHECRDQKVRQLEVEIDFYLDSLRRQSQPTATGAVVNIHGNVGAVQTGANAVANLVIQTADRDQLVQALDQLRAAVERSEISIDERNDLVSLVDDSKEAVMADRPSGPRLFGLLSGLGQAVQTLGSARAAWEAVKAAAAAVGFSISP
jgi:hypothetical protein